MVGPAWRPRVAVGGQETGRALIVASKDRRGGPERAQVVTIVAMM